MIPTKNQFEQLIKSVHENAVKKQFWNDTVDRRKVLMLVVSELSEAVEAIRTNKYSDMEGYLSMIPSHNFIDAFEAQIKDTFEDEIGDTFVRLLDYAAMYSTRFETIRKYYEQEFNVWDGVEIKCMTSMIFSTTRTIQDIFYTSWGSQKIGESLGQLHSIARYKRFNLMKYIELKMKYNLTRPIKNGKEF